MKIQSILLTGDDGYNSIGIRLVSHYLKLRKKYRLHIFGTKFQQSGIGGKITLDRPIKWGVSKVEGIEAFWTDGTVCDSLTFFDSYLNKKFDLVISGVNLGTNVTMGTTISSGTFVAAYKTLISKVARRAIVLSWDLPPKFWKYNHKGDEKFSNFFDYPGQQLDKIIAFSIKNNLWGSDILNINFPRKKTNKFRFTKIYPIALDYWENLIINEENNTFLYPNKTIKLNGKNEFDAGAVSNGIISISPININVLNKTAYQQMKNKVYCL